MAQREIGKTKSSKLAFTPVNKFEPLSKPPPVVTIPKKQNKPSAVPAKKTPVVDKDPNVHAFSKYTIQEQRDAIDAMRKGFTEDLKKTFGPNPTGESAGRVISTQIRDLSNLLTKVNDKLESEIFSTEFARKNPQLRSRYNENLADLSKKVTKTVIKTQVPSAGDIGKLVPDIHKMAESLFTAIDGETLWKKHTNNEPPQRLLDAMLDKFADSLGPISQRVIDDDIDYLEILDSDYESDRINGVDPADTKLYAEQQLLHRQIENFNICRIFPLIPSDATKDPEAKFPVRNKETGQIYYVSGDQYNRIQILNRVDYKWQACSARPKRSNVDGKFVAGRDGNSSEILNGGYYSICYDYFTAPARDGNPPSAKLIAEMLVDTEDNRDRIRRLIMKKRDLGLRDVTVTQADLILKQLRHDIRPVAIGESTTEQKSGTTISTSKLASIRKVQEDKAKEEIDNLNEIAKSTGIDNLPKRCEESLGRGGKLFTGYVRYALMMMLMVWFLHSLFNYTTESSVYIPTYETASKDEIMKAFVVEIETDNQMLDRKSHELVADVFSSIGIADAIPDNTTLYAEYGTSFYFAGHIDNCNQNQLVDFIMDDVSEDAYFYARRRSQELSKERFPTKKTTFVPAKISEEVDKIFKRNLYLVIPTHVIPEEVPPGSFNKEQVQYVKYLQTVLSEVRGLVEKLPVSELKEFLKQEGNLKRLWDRFAVKSNVIGVKKTSKRVFTLAENLKTKLKMLPTRYETALKVNQYMDIVGTPEWDELHFTTQMAIGLAGAAMKDQVYDPNSKNWDQKLSAVALANSGMIHQIFAENENSPYRPSGSEVDEDTPNYMQYSDSSNGLFEMFKNSWRPVRPSSKKYSKKLKVDPKTGAESNQSQRMSDRIWDYTAHSSFIFQLMRLPFLTFAKSLVADITWQSVQDDIFKFLATAGGFALIHALKTYYEGVANPFRSTYFSKVGLNFLIFYVSASQVMLGGLLSGFALITMVYSSPFPLWVSNGILMASYVSKFLGVDGASTMALVLTGNNTATMDLDSNIQMSGNIALALSSLTSFGIGGVATGVGGVFTSFMNRMMTREKNNVNAVLKFMEVFTASPAPTPVMRALDGIEGVFFSHINEVVEDVVTKVETTTDEGKKTERSRFLLASILVALVGGFGVLFGTQDAISKQQFKENSVVSYFKAYDSFSNMGTLAEIVDASIRELDLMSVERLEIPSHEREILAEDAFLKDFGNFVERSEDDIYFIRAVSNLPMQTIAKKAVALKNVEFLVAKITSRGQEDQTLVIEGGRTEENRLSGYTVIYDASGKEIGKEMNVIPRQNTLLRRDAEYEILNQETIGLDTLYLVSFVDRDPIWLRSSYFADKSELVYNHSERTFQSPFRVQANRDSYEPSSFSIEKGSEYDMVEEAGDWYPIVKGSINTPDKSSGPVDKRFVTIFESPTLERAFAKPQSQDALVIKDSVALNIHSVTHSWRGQDDRLSYRLVRSDGYKDEILWLPENQVSFLPELPFEIVLTRDIELGFWTKILNFFGLSKDIPTPKGTVLRVLNIDKAGKFEMIHNSTNVTVSLSDLFYDIIYPENVQARLIVKIGRPPRRKTTK